MASRSMKGHNSAASGSSSTAEPTPSAVLDVALERLAQCLTPIPQAWSQRQAMVNEHVRRLQQHWHTHHEIRISPFGSSLSGLCLADSDIDLGLFGVMHGVSLEAITSGQAKKLLYSILNGLHRAHLVHGKVQTVMGARVPVLKYTCALSGLDVDISIQGTGALVKANFMALLNQHCPALSPLYRLVKLWAAAHDINDASRSTFNSTSLLYFTAFFLQTRQLVPPLQELVDPALLNDPARRLLCEPNRWLWDRPEHLNELLGAARHRVQAWVRAQQQQRGKAWSQQSLGELLHGFFTFYADLFTDWVTGKRRGVYVDLWAGQLSSSRPAHEQLGRDYLINLQDPFDPSDCPARAIGSARVDNGGVAVLVTYLLACSSTAMARFPQPDSSSSGGGSDGGSDGGSSSLRVRLCQCLAWLFGPPGVLHLCPTVAVAFGNAASQAAPNGVSSAAAAAGFRAGGANSSHAHSHQQHWQAWAASPFERELVAALLQRRQQQQQAQQQQGGSSHGAGRRAQPETPAALFRWLVSSLQASVEPEQGACVLCLAHLSLLMSRVEARTISGTLGARLAAEAASRKALKQEQLQKLEEWRQQCQQQLLPGPPLPEPDAQLLKVYNKLAAILQSQRWKPRPDSRRKSPASHPRSIKEAARDAVTQVARRMQALGAAHHSHHHHRHHQHHHHQHHHQQQQQHGGEQDPHLLTADMDQADVQHDGGEAAASASAAAGAQLEGDSFLQEDPAAAAAAAGSGEVVAEGIGGYGLLAVLEQHGFMQLFEQWHFTAESGQIWLKLLPLPEQLKQYKQQQHQQPQGHPVADGGSSAGDGAADGAAAAAVVHDADDGHAAPSLDERPQLVGAAGSSSGGQEAQAASQTAVRADAGRAFMQLFDQWHVPADLVAAPSSHEQQHRHHPHPQQQAVQPVQRAKQHQQQQQQWDARQPAGGSGGARRHGSRSPAAAVPIDMEPGDAPPLATHADGLAERYCRQLQEQLSMSPPPKVPAVHQGQARQQQQQQQQRGKQQVEWAAGQPRPATSVLVHPASSGRVGVSQASSSSMRPAATPPAAAAAAAAAKGAAAATAKGAAAKQGSSPSGTAPKTKALSMAERRLKQAVQKVKQVQQQIDKAAAQIVARREEEDQAHKTVQRLLSAAGAAGESALSQADRQSLLEAKNRVRSAGVALKAQHVNLEQAQGKLEQAETDKAAAEAAFFAAHASATSPSYHLMQQIDKAVERMVAKREEQQQAQRTIQRLMSAAGPAGESALSEADRQALLDAKELVRSTGVALRTQHDILERAQAKLEQAEKDKAAAEAAGASAGAGGAPSTSAFAIAGAAAQAGW